jgi:hypothetical protein
MQGKRATAPWTAQLQGIGEGGGGGRGWRSQQAGLRGGLCCIKKQSGGLARAVSHGKSAGTRAGGAQNSRRTAYMRARGAPRAAAGGWPAGLPFATRARGSVTDRVTRARGGRQRVKLDTRIALKKGPGCVGKQRGQGKTRGKRRARRYQCRTEKGGWEASWRDGKPPRGTEAERRRQGTSPPAGVVALVNSARGCCWEAVKSALRRDVVATADSPAYDWVIAARAAGSGPAVEGS